MWSVEFMNDTTNKSKLNTRRGLLGAACCLLFVDICEAKPMNVVLNVVVFNYLDRPILDVLIDGKVGETSDAYPDTGGGTVLDVELALGPKKVTWRLDGPKGMARNGETVTNKNPLQLLEVVPDARYLGIHIYPDDSVELTTSAQRPNKTSRGEIENAKLGKKHG
jgi:hypothetical protein